MKQIEKVRKIDKLINEKYSCKMHLDSVKKQKIVPDLLKQHVHLGYHHGIVFECIAHFYIEQIRVKLLQFGP